MFSDQFAFDPHALVNFVGGGGKTALIHRLMEEFHSRGTVLHTTTTRIHPPHPGEGAAVISCDDPEILKLMLGRIGSVQSDHFYKLTVTLRYISPTLLRGVPVDFARSLSRENFSILLNEADGAAGFSIKLPRENEPMLMQDAQYLVPVIGIDCLGQVTGAETVFRWKEAAERFSLKANERITPDLAAHILMHPMGLCRGYQSGTTIIPFVNKVDSPAQDQAAKALALSILRNGNFPVNRVLIGSVIKGRIDSISVS